LIQKILIPLDGSKLAEKALDFGLDLAEKYSAETVLLSVVPHLFFPSTIDPITGEQFLSPETIEELEEGAEAYHREVLSKAFK